MSYRQEDKDLMIQNAQQLIKTRANQLGDVIRSYQHTQRTHSDSTVVLDYELLAEIFENAYTNPIMTTTKMMTVDPPTTFVVTGGWRGYGPARCLDDPDYDGQMTSMWTRDAICQYHAYLNLFTDSKYTYPAEQLNCLKTVIEGVIRMNVRCLLKSFYSHAFTEEYSVISEGEGYEPDSQCWIIWLANEFYQATGDTGHFDTEFEEFMRLTVENFSKEQHHEGMDYTGMMWCELRTDDDCWLHYHLPDNLFASVILGLISEIALKQYNNKSLSSQAIKLQSEINEGIAKYGTVCRDQPGNVMYAYETDGKGRAEDNTFRGDGTTQKFTLSFDPFTKTTSADIFKQAEFSLEVLVNGSPLQPLVDYKIDERDKRTLIMTPAPEKGAQVTVRGNFVMMDDAGIPSLLSIPYLGFASLENDVVKATRNYALSASNPFYYQTQDSGKDCYQGVGSPHLLAYANWDEQVWPMAMIMEGMTSDSEQDRLRILDMLIRSAVDCKKKISFFAEKEDLCEKYPAVRYIHESFYVNPVSETISGTYRFTRGWFAWVNALFGEWLDHMITTNTFPRS